MPGVELETLNIPAVHVRRGSKHLSLLEPPPASKIARVVVCFEGERQYVFSYDANKNRLSYYTGWFHDVGIRVLSEFGNRNWEQQFGPGLPEWDEAFLTASA